MSDRIVGVAILDETSTPARLHFVCERANGDRKPWIDSIPVRPMDSPELPGTISWEYRDKGERLDMRPSVKMSEVCGHTEDTPPKPIWREFFHNDGQWSVLFIRWKPRRGYVSDGSGVDFEGIRAQLKTLNAHRL
jgi:hypothetical protein